MSHKQQISCWGENVAADFFSGQGFVIAGRNLRTHYSEIDLIVRRDNLTVPVEVKAWISSLFGPPEVAILSRKQEHLHAAVERYLQEHAKFGGRLAHRRSRCGRVAGLQTSHHAIRKCHISLR